MVWLTGSSDRGRHGQDGASRRGAAMGEQEQAGGGEQAGGATRQRGAPVLLPRRGSAARLLPRPVLVPQIWPSLGGATRRQARRPSLDGATRRRARPGPKGTGSAAGERAPGGGG
ncbi:hypothetical protein U9M48_030340 [Paspalum notatum var. saurae]|uniref:Uncharacterized protein n=1 Tax=Paspalum notatum var. saurae TaxID=547442 RepID=A0AAQ3U3F5_PASNO